MTKIKKAVIAAAGSGTRFLPQTKAMPKEMLPLVDKPIIQYVVEELHDAGITDIIIVTGYHKRSIEDHFDQISEDLRQHLKRSNKQELLKEIKKISDMANFVYLRQKGPYGNATALLNSEHLVNNEPFIYTFADDFIVSEPSRFKQMIKAYEKTQSSILACVKVDKDSDYDRYGIVDGVADSSGMLKMQTIIEKPGKKDAPGDLATVSSYIFTPAIYKYLHQTYEDVRGNEEFILQPAVQQMSQDGHNVYALEIKGGKFYDTGNKLEYLKTIIDFGLKHPKLADDLRSYMRQVLK